MYTTQLLFRRKTRGIGDHDAAHAIVGLLVALKHNGQIVDRGAELAVNAGRSGYRAIVSLPEPDSLRSSFYNKHVRAAIRKLRKAGLQPPSQRQVGRELESASECTCRELSSLILETGFLCVDPPLRCGGCMGIVPFYRFRHTRHETYEDIRYWAQRYRCLDTLWTQSGVGEQFAYRELSRHDSDLSKTGRGICRAIEQRTGARTYYYLYRWHGRSEAAERRRRCPSCGKNWLLEAPWHGRFDFRCDRCRLLSNVGLDVR
jgi:predicted  nucleic acid-binding Zn ribbon protein